MSAFEGQTCPRCEDDQLRLDEQDGFLLCPSCGYVAEEGLYGGPVEADAGEPDVTVAVQQGVGDGQALGEETGQPIAAGSAAYGPTAATMDAAKRLRAVASVLPLSNRCIEDALAFLAQVRERHLVQLGGANNTVDAQIAGLLFLSARLLKQPLSLTEVASAAQVSRGAAAAQMKKVVAALKVQLPPPSAGLRAHTWRMASNLYQELKAGREQQAAAGIGAPMPEGNMLQQPLVRTALTLCDLVGKLNIGESRSPPILAGAILMLVCEQHSPQQLGLARKPGVQDIVHLVGCNKLTLKDVRGLIVKHLMQMAALLPMGAHITEANLLSYLPLIASLATTMAQCMTVQPPAHP